MRNFHSRPFRVLQAERLVEACLLRVGDPQLQDAPMIGSIDQWVDSTDVLEDPERTPLTGAVYGWTPSNRIPKADETTGETTAGISPFNMRTYMTSVRTRSRPATPPADHTSAPAHSQAANRLHRRPTRALASAHRYLIEVQPFRLGLHKALRDRCTFV